jgi:hypothetical protein
MPNKIHEMLEVDPAVPVGAETIGDDWKSAGGTVETPQPENPGAEPQLYYTMFCHSCIGFTWPRRYNYEDARVDAAVHDQENEGHATEVR